MAFEEQLVKLVKQNACIYDRKCALYRNEVVRSNTWKGISEALQIDEKTCRRKWKHMRDTFIRDEKRNKVAFIPEEGRWKFHNIMTFLRGKIDMENENLQGSFIYEDDETTFDPTNSMDCEDNNSITRPRFEEVIAPNICIPQKNLNASSRLWERDRSDNDDIVFYEVDASPAGSIDGSMLRNNIKHLPNKRRGMVKRRAEKNILKEVVHEFKRIKHELSEDPTDIFFRSAAIQTKTLNLSARQMIDLQVEILNVIKSRIPTDRTL